MHDVDDKILFEATVAVLNEADRERVSQIELQLKSTGRELKGLADTLWVSDGNVDCTRNVGERLAAITNKLDGIHSLVCSVRDEGARSWGMRNWEQQNRELEVCRCAFSAAGRRLRHVFYQDMASLLELQQRRVKATVKREAHVFRVFIEGVHLQGGISVADRNGHDGALIRLGECLYYRVMTAGARERRRGFYASHCSVRCRCEAIFTLREVFKLLRLIGALVQSVEAKEEVRKLREKYWAHVRRPRMREAWCE